MSTEPDNIDYKQTLNIGKVHASVEREADEPNSRRDPLPLWVFLGCIFVVLLGGSYLGANVGGFSANTYLKPGYTPQAPEVEGGAVVAEELSPEEQWLKDGEKVYKLKGACIGCHQKSGAGAAGQFPPLVGSEWVINGDERLVMLLLHGLSGPLVVKGAPYNGQMPAQAQSLSDKEIAQVASYIRNEWGNQAAFVTEENVRAAREKYSGQVGTYTQEDLEKVPQGQDLPGPEFGEGTEATGGEA